jgi:hypothetical protein
MPTFIQPSFAKGEIGPALYGRVDTAAYQVALRTARNTIVHAHGGISNRPGLQFICPCKDHTKRPVLLDFQFKATDTYVIEVGNLYARFIRNDAQILEATKTITAATKANPCVITISSHGYSNGDHVFITGVGGMTELNARFFQIANKTTNTFELTSVYDAGSSNINSSAFTTYTSGGTCGKVYQITMPYAQADLDQLKWTQSADVMTITHPTYGVRELTRTNHNAWTLTAPTFAPSIAAPTGVSLTVNGADNNIFWKYKVTAIKDGTFEESLAGLNNTGLTVASATAANPVVVTISGHGLLTGDEVQLTGFTEMTEVNDRRFSITKVNANSFSLNGEDGSAYTAESTGGSNTCFATFDGAGTAAAPTGTTIPDNTLTWTAVAGAKSYTIYRAKGGSGTFGFRAETLELTYTDDTAAETLTDLSITPPEARNPFRIAGEYPASVGYYQQRRVFGGSTDQPDTSEYSQTANQSNFSKSSPAQADDAITATLSSRQVNQIRHFVPGTDLIILTDGAEWRINSGDNSGFAGDTLKQEPQTHWGANHLKPHVVGTTILYVQENNIAIRSLGYQLNIDGYTGTDLTLLAPQIFDATTAISWAYSRSPDPLISVVRADGTVGVMTFDAEQEVVAWCRWDTLGAFKWCAAMRPSATDVHDATYFVVERIIDSNTVLFIERTASRRFTDVQDAFFVDSGLSLDSPLAITNATVANPVVVTSASHGLSNGDFIDIEGIKWTTQFDSSDNESNPDQLNGRQYIVASKATNTVSLVLPDSDIHITAFTNASPGAVTTSEAHGLTSGDIIALHGMAGATGGNDLICTATVTGTTTFTIGADSSSYGTYTNGGTVHAAEDGSAFEAYVSNGNMRQAVLTISALNHLEGEEVVILANGNVITGKTVSAGVITLARRASRVHVGKKYIADIQTLNVEAPGGTIQGQPTKLSQVTIRFEKSRGLLIGPSTSQLVEMKQREFEVMGAPTELLTGDKEIKLKPNWNTNGRLFLRQNNPLPITVLAIIPNVQVGADG